MYLLYIPGTFSQDALRLIKDSQNRTLDDIIRIYEDLCTLVFNTVSAYSVWFVLHWFTYGAGVVTTVIYISKESLLRNKYHTDAVEFVFLSLILVFTVYVFIFPCVCAARITSNCAGKLIIDLHPFHHRIRTPNTFQREFALLR